MSKSVTLHLDDFGQEALAAYAERAGHSARFVVGVAALYYLADSSTPSCTS